MKLIIDIPDEQYNLIKLSDKSVFADASSKECMLNSIKKGIPYDEKTQGEWIMQRHDLDGCFYTCSNCGRMIRVSLFIDDPEDNETLADYPYCHCGASMKGGAE